jgi:branched-chain amino acid transport system permease protein
MSGLAAAPTQAAEAARSRWLGLAALMAFMAVLPLVLPNAFYYDVVIRICINAIIVLGLNLLIGYTGQISLGHAGFYGGGAYVSAILVEHYHVPPPLALIAAAVAIGATAWLVAGAILRLKGHYLAMATLGLGIIISIVITNESRFTGGPDGMSISDFSLFGLRVSGEKQWYWVFAGLLVLAVILAQNLIDSPAGRALQALHGSEIAARVSGIPAAKFKTRVFVLSAVVASVMGSLSAHYMGFITPGLAAFPHSVELVTMVVVGGMASIYGSLFGAALLTVLPQLLARFEGWETVIFGVILVGTMIFLPRGVVPSLAALLRRKEA